MDIEKELADIKELIVSAQIIATVRSEVKEVLNGKNAIVIGGKQARNITNSNDYDLIVMHKNGIEASELISRRIKAKIPDAKIESLSSALSENVLGIKHSRRIR